MSESEAVILETAIFREPAKFTVCRIEIELSPSGDYAVWFRRYHSGKTKMPFFETALTRYDTLEDAREYFVYRVQLQQQDKRNKSILMRCSMEIPNEGLDASLVSWDLVDASGWLEEFSSV